MEQKHFCRCETGVEEMDKERFIELEALCSGLMLILSTSYEMIKHKLCIFATPQRVKCELFKNS